MRHWRQIMLEPAGDDYRGVGTLPTNRWLTIVIAGLLSASLMFFALSAAAQTKRNNGAGVLSIVVPKYSIEQGTIINDDMLTTKRFIARSVRHLDIFFDKAEIIGQEARRRLRSGHPVPTRSITYPKMVRRGRPAQLIFKSGTLFITAQVEPLESGGPGDLVRVRNVDSGLVITGIVDSNGVLLVKE